MSSGVISATDNFEQLRLGRAGFDALVRARNRSLEEELAIRSSRVEELRRGVVWRKPPPAVLPQPSARPAWSKRPTQTAREHLWSVVLRPDVRPRYTIHLEGETARTILAEVADVAPERLETGGLTFGWERARSNDARIIHVSGAGAGSLHGPRSLPLATEKDTRRAMPDWLAADDLKRIGCWHYHPSAGASRPSRADLNAWAAFLSKAEAGCIDVYPSIIVTPGSGGLGPEFHGWVTHGQRGRYVCQPAVLSDRLGYCS